MNFTFQTATAQVETGFQSVLAICRDDAGLSLWGGFVHDGWVNPDYGLVDDGEGDDEAGAPVAWSAYPGLPTFVAFDELSEVSKAAIPDELPKDDGAWIDLRGGKVKVPDADRSYLGLLRTTAGIMIIKIAVDRNGYAVRPYESMAITADGVEAVTETNAELVAIYPLPTVEELDDLIEGLNVIH